MSNTITRRSALLGGVGLGLGVLGGGPLLAGCSSTVSSDAAASAAAAAARDVALPAYVRYRGVEPDIPGNNEGIADAFFAYPASPVRATTGRPGDGDRITAMTSLNGPIPPGVAANAYWRDLNRRLGSPLAITPTPLQDYSQKFATTMASGDLPDVFNMLNVVTPQLPQMLEATAVDLTAHLSGDAVRDYPNLANIPTGSWQATVYSGKIMAVPIPRGVTQSVGLYYRKDLLQKRGITFRPSSFDEFSDLCGELTDARHNTWALAVAPIDYVRQMLGVPNNWSYQNGRLTSAYEHEGQKEALAAVRRLIERGRVNPDAFSGSAQDAKTRFGNGQAMFTVDTQSAWNGYFIAAAGIKGFDVDMATVPAFDGNGTGHPWIGNMSHSVAAIGKRAERRIEAVLRVLDYLAAPFGTEEYRFLKYGVEHVDFELDGTDPIKTAKGNTEAVIGSGYLADGPVAIYQAGLREVTKTRYAAQTRLFPTGVKDPTSNLFSATQSGKGNFLTTRITSLQNDILQGRQPVSAWDDGVASWRSGGGSQIREELQTVLEGRS